MSYPSVISQTLLPQVVFTQETSVHITAKVDDKIIALLIDSTDFTDEDCTKWCNDETGKPAAKEVKIIIKDKSRFKNSEYSPVLSVDDAISTLCSEFIQ